MTDVTFLCFSFSLNGAIGFLINTENNSDIESSSAEDQHNLAMLPPIENENAETDMDSHISDDKNDGLYTIKARVCLTKHINKSLFNALNPQIRNQENQLPETGKKALTCSQL